MIKKLLIIASSLTLIGLIGTLITLKKDSIFEVTIPTSIQNLGDSTSTTIPHQLLTIEFENSTSQSFHDLFTLTSSNNSITIKEKEKSGFIKLSSHSQLTLTGTEGLLNKLSIELLSTDIIIQNIDAERVTVQSISGNIEMNNINAASVKVKNISGNIHLVEANGDLTLDSVSGDIHLKNHTLLHPINGTTISGDQSFQFSDPLEDVKFFLSTVSGNINFLDELDSAEQQDATIVVLLNSVSGNITIY